MSTFRKAAAADIPVIAAIYDHTHDLEERGETTIGWIRGVYPTEETAREALDADDVAFESHWNKMPKVMQLD